MPNKNYEKGRRKEYKICEELKEEGFDIVQRTAGSHSPFDVIAINKNLRVIKLIQSKPDNLLMTQKNALELNNHWLNNVFRVEFIVK